MKSIKIKPFWSRLADILLKGNLGCGHEYHLKTRVCWHDTGQELFQNVREKSRIHSSVTVNESAPVLSDTVTIKDFSVVSTWLVALCHSSTKKLIHCMAAIALLFPAACMLGMDVRGAALLYTSSHQGVSRVRLPRVKLLQTTSFLRLRFYFS